MYGLTKGEEARLRKLTTPAMIQDFLDAIPMNHEKQGETHRSVHAALTADKAHCIEGALIAAAALMLQGEKPLLMDLTAHRPDDDHVVALYKKNGYWGAISKTNHPTIRFRDPVYRTLRELALSYFHEWFMNGDGKKTLKSFSKPLNLRKFGTDWITSEKDLWYLDKVLNQLPHYALVPKGNAKYIRTADKMELAAGRIIEWPESDTRT
ncbi:MAG TPA: hypothetical protein VHC20_02200 [Candidatus Paceibacterota bacterium]|nr:hypothetical protein [Candidatus Paceibacterota bacterium]